MTGESGPSPIAFVSIDQFIAWLETHGAEPITLHWLSPFNSIEEALAGMVVPAVLRDIAKCLQMAEELEPQEKALDVLWQSGSPNMPAITKAYADYVQFGRKVLTPKRIYERLNEMR